MFLCYFVNVACAADCVSYLLTLDNVLSGAGDEVKVVSTPPFAESVTEGDVKWIKGTSFFFA